MGEHPIDKEKRGVLNPTNTVYINQQDIIKDIIDIKELLEERTGMFISGPNVIRACVKAWYDLNNNG